MIFFVRCFFVKLSIIVFFNFIALTDSIFQFYPGLKLLTKLHSLFVWVTSPNHLWIQIGTLPKNPEFKMFSLIVNNCNYFYLMHWKSNIRVHVCLRVFVRVSIAENLSLPPGADLVLYVYVYSDPRDNSTRICREHTHTTTMESSFDYR